MLSPVGISRTKQSFANRHKGSNLNVKCLFGTPNGKFRERHHKPLGHLSYWVIIPSAVKLALVVVLFLPWQEILVVRNGQSELG
jgi:hypothetical protein